MGAGKIRLLLPDRESRIHPDVMLDHCGYLQAQDDMAKSRCDRVLFRSSVLAALAPVLWRLPVWRAVYLRSAALRRFVSVVFRAHKAYQQTGNHRFYRRRRFCRLRRSGNYALKCLHIIFLL